MTKKKVSYYIKYKNYISEIISMNKLDGNLKISFIKGINIKSQFFDIMLNIFSHNNTILNVYMLSLVIL